jgi:hypothetical protein
MAFVSTFTYELVDLRTNLSSWLAIHLKHSTARLSKHSAQEINVVDLTGTCGRLI